MTNSQSSKKATIKKNDKDNKKTTPKKKKQNLNTIPPSGQILQYLVKKKANSEEERKIVKKISMVEDIARKHEDNKKTTVEDMKKKELEENKKENELNKERKTTFVNKKKEKVKENIEMFHKLSMGEECIVGSGHCSRHNVKLERKVTIKKVSNIDSTGKVTWTMREVANLACPFKQRKLPVGTSSTMMSSNRPPEGTNGNFKKFRSMVMDQSHARTKTAGVGEDQMNRQTGKMD